MWKNSVRRNVFPFYFVQLLCMFAVQLLQQQRIKDPWILISGSYMELLLILLIENPVQRLGATGAREAMFIPSAEALDPRYFMSRYVRNPEDENLLQRNDPEKFVNPGIDPPKGVLCYGPPGTGKTLLARAVANRTDACFICVIGSELVKKYVGEGARLVRELFQMARSKKACIVFFDQLDAIGGARFDDGVDGDNEVQRTKLEIVNQLDGFDARGNIKVLMATNRPDTLNPSVTSGSVVSAI
ncbi:26S proteasome regulatory subunit 7-like [Camellia sinensis]|uniref:26S proteasome regulatory subunit 7-like n=1 Tax=Camellia sinensis TaxID=4442 RepID=UPI001036CDD5|nr:26S proteasome regulatory subunit 7-like [Camellia sinensis]